MTPKVNFGEKNELSVAEQKALEEKYWGC